MRCWKFTQPVYVSYSFCVAEKSFFKSSIAFSEHPLAFYGMLKDLIVDYGTALHLTCPVLSGGNPVTTEWYKDGEVIAIKSGIRFITISQHTDGGMYHCVAVQGDQWITSNVFKVKIRGIFISS